MSDPAFLDTNVLLRHVLSDISHQSPHATTFLERVQLGEETVRISETVVVETVFTLEKFYRIPRPEIQDALLGILTLQNIILPDKEGYRDVFDLFVAHRPLSFADCYHAVLMKRLGLTEIISFDRGFDRLPGIIRREPA